MLKEDLLSFEGTEFVKQLLMAKSPTPNSEVLSQKNYIHKLEEENKLLRKTTVELAEEKDQLAVENELLRFRGAHKVEPTGNEQFPELASTTPTPTSWDANDTHAMFSYFAPK